MSDYLVKRLREKRQRCHDLSGVYWTKDMDCQEAADRIEQLAATNEGLEAKLLETQNRANDWAAEEYYTEIRAEQAEAKLAKAVEALGKVQAFVKELEPYADQGTILHPALYEACMVYERLK